MNYKEKIEYTDWKTGEERERELSNAHPAEHKTNLVCPFDKTPIIRYHNCHGNKGYECPNCGIEYNINNGTQEQVRGFAKKYFKSIQKEIKELDQKKKELSDMLDHAKTKGLVGWIKSINKDNLSS